MSKYRVFAEKEQQKATENAALKIITSGSALKRVGQAGLRVLRGEEAVPESAQELKNLLMNNVFGVRPDPHFYLSRFGTPVRNYLRIVEGSYDVLDGSGALVKRRYLGTMLDSAIINLQLPKNIVFTDINGRNGTRKEFVSNGDWSIQITGTLASRHHSVYPVNEVAVLRDILASPEPLSVISPYLQMFGINTIVVIGSDFPQNEGSYNEQKFAINAMSHQPIDIYIEAAQKEDETKKSRVAEVVDEYNQANAEAREKINEALGGFYDRGNL